jgi:hypothetical protein
MQQNKLLQHERKWRNKEIKNGVAVRLQGDKASKHCRTTKQACDASAHRAATTPAVVGSETKTRERSDGEGKRARPAEATAKQHHITCTVLRVRCISTPYYCCWAAAGDCGTARAGSDLSPRQDAGDVDQDAPAQRSSGAADMANGKWQILYQTPCRVPRTC